MEGFSEYEKALELNTHVLNPYVRYRYGLSAISYSDISYHNFPEKTDKELLRKAIRMQEKNMENEWTSFTRNYTVAAKLCNALSQVGEKGYTEKAEFFLREALKLSPNRPSIYLAIADTNVVAGNLEEAEKNVKRALDINRFDKKAISKLTSIKTKQQQLKQAERMLIDKGLVFEKDIDKTKRALAFEIGGDLYGALNLYKELSLNHPDVAYYQEKIDEVSSLLHN